MLLLFWIIFNILIGIWEIYIFLNRDKLYLEKESIFSSKKKINNFFIDGWAEYCKVDSRYIYKPYVWSFELINALLAFVLLAVMFYPNWIKLILILQIINCSGYFLTLLLELLQKNEIYVNLKKYSSFWMIPTYYFISFIWILIPSYILYKI
jgi:hypothetical protein